MATGADFRGIDLTTWKPKLPSSPSAIVRQNYSCVDESAVDKLWTGNFRIKDRSKKVSKVPEDLCLRAWITFMAVSKSQALIRAARCKPVDTKLVGSPDLSLVTLIVMEDELVERAKPVRREAEIISHTYRNGEWDLTNMRYKTRIRSDAQTWLAVTTRTGRVIQGRVTGTQGKTTTISGRGRIKGFKSIHVIGKESKTFSDNRRDALVLSVLQGLRPLSSVNLIQRLWFPTDSTTPKPQITGSAASNNPRLNSSQANVVKAMTTSNESVIVVHGPPGTGKTHTISAASQIWSRTKRGSFIVAQSNVAVKNIAESLSRAGVKYKLMVSKDFYEEWHEHLYENIPGNYCRSDQLPYVAKDMDILFHEINIVLCTVCTLYSPTIRERGLFRRVPLDHLVIDEASQISILEFLPLLVEFPKLEKICFFGDPRQLPPYNQDAAPDLKCIFDMPHFKPSSYFLDTQYRMPTPIGKFISERVYNSKLESIHSIQQKSCVAFVDVADGEDKKQGTSWTNEREAQNIVFLVRNYYCKEKFCVITPYDAQKTLIEQYLKAAGLPWERVFNIDSFQGNEDDFILISLVRTKNLGFMISKNRVNVMLTRCKKGMVIVSNKDFLRLPKVQTTLVGKIAKAWGESAWRTWNSVLNRQANLPGFDLQ